MRPVAALRSPLVGLALGALVVAEIASVIADRALLRAEDAEEWLRPQELRRREAERIPWTSCAPRARV
jgi:hypothetical protein